MRLATGRAATRPIRDLLAATGPCVTVPAFARPSVALLAGAVPSVCTPFVTTASFTVACLTMPGALRTLAGAARAALSLLCRGWTRVAAAGVGAEILTRQCHLDQPLDVAEIGEFL